MTKTESIQRSNDETDLSRNLLARRASRVEASRIQKRGKSRVDVDSQFSETSTLAPRGGIDSGADSAAGEDAEPGHRV